jgi:putative endonuclease
MARMDFIAVYIVASKRNGTLYTGVTSDLLTRIAQHRNGEIPGFPAKYGCKQLVWFEQHAEIEEAIGREKRIKRWLRKWKLALIEANNPSWRDLYEDFLLPRHITRFEDRFAPGNAFPEQCR